MLFMEKDNNFNGLYTIAIDECFVDSAPDAEAVG